MIDSTPKNLAAELHFLVTLFNSPTGIVTSEDVCDVHGLGHFDKVVISDISFELIRLGIITRTQVAQSHRSKYFCPVETWQLQDRVKLVDRMQAVTSQIKSQSDGA